MAKILRFEYTAECPYFDGEALCNHDLEAEDEISCAGAQSKDCPLPDADEYDRALIVRGIEMLLGQFIAGGVIEPIRPVATKLIQEVRDGKH